MSPLEPALVFAIAGIGIVFVIDLKEDQIGCRDCDHCRRKKQARIDARAAAKERAEQAAHDVDHKGFGYRNGAPDRYRCADDDCTRNPK